MPVEQVQIAGAVLDVAVPERSYPGVSMAGFRGKTPDPVELQMIPYPASTLFLDFGDALLTDDNNGTQRRGSVVVGLATGTLHGSGRDVDVLQVRLSPVVAHAVLGPGADIGAAVLTLEDLWGRDAERTEERLRATTSWEERFAIVHRVLARQSGAGRAVDREVAFTWSRMVATRGQVRIEQLADEVGWSRQRLWSRFRAQVGLTPKYAARLIRFDHAAHRLAAGHSAATVAADGGFTDQSHLHHDVTAFAGMSTSAVAEALWLVVDPVAWPARIPRT
ncbi:helix-turn-helix domain-containing protein [Nocardia sp. NPDC052254]|uniref:helix-turn-helix domain-containing protein n=1 Tax=Nocardia sp. NPDC052254 TaxID=3155681 RepID=UPI003424BB01